MLWWHDLLRLELIPDALAFFREAPILYPDTQPKGEVLPSGERLHFAMEKST